MNVQVHCYTGCVVLLYSVANEGICHNECTGTLLHWMCCFVVQCYQRGYLSQWMYRYVVTLDVLFCCSVTMYLYIHCGRYPRWQNCTTKQHIQCNNVPVHSLWQIPSLATLYNKTTHPVWQCTCTFIVVDTLVGKTVRCRCEFNCIACCYYSWQMLSDFIFILNIFYS
jgi:hypothetical protein